MVDIEFLHQLANKWEEKAEEYYRMAASNNQSYENEKANMYVEGLGNAYRTAALDLKYLIVTEGK